MKTKIAAALFICAMCISFAACGGSNTDKPTNEAAIGSAESGADNTESNGTFPDLSAVVDSIKKYYGDNMTYVSMADEYSDEVLMYTYGLYDDKFTEAVSDFILSECDGMSADTFALIAFKAGTDKALIEEAASVMEDEYITSLKNKLAAYNPEEFKASDGYKLEIYDDAVLMVISSDNTDEIMAAVGK